MTRLLVLQILGLLITTGVLTAQKPPSSSVQQGIVLRYFREVVDAGRQDVLKEIVLPDCAIHRPEGELRGMAAFHSWLASRRATFSAFRSHVQDMIESGDRVVVRLTHEVTGAGPYRFRIGTYDLSNKTFRWDSIVIFRFEDGKIAEEWVSRDELGMLLATGVLKLGGAVR